jgi:prolyl oligopeptidase
MKRGFSLLGAISLGAQLASASRAFSTRASMRAPSRSARWGAKAAVGLGFAAAASGASAEHAADDKIAYWEKRQGEHSWLEEVLGEKALEWVKTQNAKTVAFLGDPTGTPLYDRVLGILTSKDKIPYIRKIGDKYYNFWQDKESKRGVLRRTSLESYKTAEPEWETVLSVDALCEAEGESWVYAL